MTNGYPLALAVCVVEECAPFERYGDGHFSLSVSLLSWGSFFVQYFHCNMLSCTRAGLLRPTSGAFQRLPVPGL